MTRAEEKLVPPREAVGRVLQTERRTRKALVVLVALGFILFVTVAVFTISTNIHVQHIIVANHVQSTNQSNSSQAYISEALAQVKLLFQHEFSNITCRFAANKTFSCTSHA